MSATDTLAPCSHCNSRPVSHWVGDDDSSYWKTECHHISVKGTVVFIGVHGDDQESCEAAWNAMNRRAPAQPSREAMEMGLVNEIMGASESDLILAVEQQPAMAASRLTRLAAALTATHAKAEAEGYARGKEDAAKVCDAGLDVIADQPAPDGRPNNQAILLQHRTGMGVALREAAKHIRALPPTASAKAETEGYMRGIRAAKALATEQTGLMGDDARALGCDDMARRLEEAIDELIPRNPDIAHDQQGAIATANEQIASLARSLELASEEQDRLLILAKRAEGLPADMTPSIQEALGAMVFQTGPIAHLFQAAGYDIPHKIEMEQAFVLWRMLNCAIAHGEKWREAFGKELDAALETARAKETK